MSGDYTGFAAWLRERATAANFDLNARGGTAKLAAASGIDPAQMSRALRGQAVPAIEGQRGLAKALGVELSEVMIHAGSAEPDDFPAPGASPSLTELANHLGVPADQQQTFAGLIAALAEVARDPNADVALPHIRALVDVLNLPARAVPGRVVIAPDAEQPTAE